MKQKDILTIVVIVIISGVLSLVISNSIFVKPKDRKTEVEIVAPITSSFQELDKKYYNPQAFDPTKIITIGQNDNSDPFNSTGR